MGESARTIQDKRNTSPLGACISMGSTHRSADHNSCYIPLLFHCLFRTVPCAFVLKKHTCEYTYMHMFATGSFVENAEGKYAKFIMHNSFCIEDSARTRTTFVVHKRVRNMYNKFRARTCVHTTCCTFCGLVYVQQMSCTKVRARAAAHFCAQHFSYKFKTAIRTTNDVQRCSGCSWTASG